MTVRRGENIEKTLIEVVRQLFGDLPSGTARLEIRPLFEHMSHPYFKVEPFNRKAAAFSGYVVNDELTLSLGKRSGVELYAFLVAVEPLFQRSHGRRNSG